MRERERWLVCSFSGNENQRRLIQLSAIFEIFQWKCRFSIGFPMPIYPFAFANNFTDSRLYDIESFLLQLSPSLFRFPFFTGIGLLILSLGTFFLLVPLICEQIDHFCVYIREHFSPNIDWSKIQEIFISAAIDSDRRKCAAGIWIVLCHFFLISMPSSTILIIIFIVIVVAGFAVEVDVVVIVVVVVVSKSGLFIRNRFYFWTNEWFVFVSSLFPFKCTAVNLNTFWFNR